MTLEEFLSEWNNGSDRLLVHTSGSTGKHKPMLVEKKRMLNSARITCDFLGLKPGDSALLCMSLDYIAAVSYTHLPMVEPISELQAIPCGLIM